jgi:hypothetical protein
MADKSPAEITAQIVKLLYDSKAYVWSIQDKGILTAAIKLQLSERNPPAKEGKAA